MAAQIGSEPANCLIRRPMYSICCSILPSVATTQQMLLLNLLDPGSIKGDAAHCEQVLCACQEWQVCQKTATELQMTDMHQMPTALL